VSDGGGPGNNDRTTPSLRTEGHNVMLYRSGTRDGEVVVEVGQVTRSFKAAGRVVPSTLPAAETASTVHTGTPVEIGALHWQLA
jgi:hypothetical protein